MSREAKRILRQRKKAKKRRKERELAGVLDPAAIRRREEGTSRRWTICAIVGVALAAGVVILTLAIRG